MSEDDYEEVAYFMGVCTCPHERDAHGWGSCDVYDVVTRTECPCEAGWEE